MMATVEETLSAIRTVRGFTREDFEYQRFMSEVDSSVTENVKTLTGVNIMFTIIMIVVWTCIIGNIYYGGTMVDKEHLKPGDLMSVFGFMIFGSMGLIELQTFLQGEQKAIKNLQMIGHQPTIPFNGGQTIDNFKGHIVFENVSFKYSTREVLCPPKCLL